MWFIGMLIGGIVGASFGGGGVVFGAIVGTVAGVALKKWGGSETEETKQKLDAMQASLDYFSNELLQLKQRVQKLDKEVTPVSTTVPHAQTGAEGSAEGDELALFKPAATPAQMAEAPLVVENLPFSTIEAMESVAQKLAVTPAPPEPSAAIPSVPAAMAAAISPARTYGPLEATPPPLKVTPAPDSISQKQALPEISPEPELQPQASQIPLKPAMSPTPPPPPKPEEPSFIARLFSGNIVAKVGVVVLFFGVGFLLKFAYDRGLMPPELRLFAVAVAAVAMFGIGWWLRESRRLYGLILQGGASGLAYLDVFFALKTYAFISPSLGFGLFAALGVATTFVAVRNDARVLAVLGLGGAFLAPVLASTGGGNHVLLFSYYLLLNLFVLGVSWFRSWRELNLTGWLFTFAIGLFWGKANYHAELFDTVEPFVLTFFAIYLVIPILFATRQPPRLKGLVDGTLVFGTPAAVAFMQASLVKGLPYGLAWSAAIGGALYALLAVFTWRRENMRLLAETYAALALGLGTLAVFFAFDAYPTFAFWTIEGTAILWVGLRQNMPLARVFAILVQLAGAVLFIKDYDQIVRLHWLMNDAIYGSLLITLSSLISAHLLHRYADQLRWWEKYFSPTMLLWGALWWSVGGLDALDHGVSRQALSNAAAFYFLATFAVTEIAGRWLNWGALRNLAGFHPLVLAIVLLSQFQLHQHPLGELGGVAWPLGFALAFWSLRRQERDAVAFAAAQRYIALWAILALAATWEEIWLLEQRDYFYGLLLAAAGHFAAYLRYTLRERDIPNAGAGSSAVLLWAMVFWFAQSFAYANEHLDRPELIAAMLGFVSVSALLYEFLGSLLGWRGLRQASNVLWLALAAVLLAQFDATIHPFAAFSWLAWPSAFAVAYWSLARHERDALALATPLKHAAGLWLAVAIVALELQWRFGAWNFGSAWHTSVWGFCTATALACAVRWGDMGKWPVAPHRETYRGLVLGPVGAFTVAWALFANFKAPGSMSPLPYLPLLNPVDAMIGLSMGAAWAWSRWFIEPQSKNTSALRKMAGVLGFIWLNGIALRSIHYWANVPYEFEQLFRSVLVQATLSLLWASAALVLMFLARQRQERGLWIAGIVLLGGVVAKLFLVDLANSGTVARIVSFIGVGTLLLVIGYLAPVPPGAKDKKDVAS